MHTVAIIQARMSSTRLPGKVLRDLAGLPVLGWCVRAAQAIPGIDAVAVATSADAGDDRIAAWCGENKIICIRGPLHDVLARYALAARQLEAQAVMRLTADCPLLDPQVCGEVLQLFKQSHADYASNVAKDRSWPNGLDCEVFTADALYRAETEATLPYDREHVVPYLLDHPHFFRIESLACPLPGLGFERWTLDYPQDFAFLAEVAKHLPVGRSPSYLEVLLVLEGNPQLRNRDPIVQPAGAVPAARKETPSFAASQALLEKAERLIPQGSQTFSKSARQFPAGHAPLFLTHGEGGRVWDIDGNEYVDLVCGLLPVMLGYADPDVNDAIRRQLNNGITFSLATPLETTLAERMAELVPCAEKIRFAKNGSDATSAAIRLARAYTNRDRAMVCGYHGWQDWYIGSTSRSKGVPAAVRALSHPVPYNDLAAVEALLLKHKGEFAALIMEPVNTTLPQPGFLQDLKDLLHKHGTLLVFDEVITGFRLAKGGAQEYFGVTPDLAAFGKALGNGMPISAIAGRANIMDEMEDIFFSGTFGGETLSLAAAIAVLDKIKREPVIETLWSTGERLRNGVDGLLKQYGLEDVLIQRGLAPWVILDFQPHPKATKEAIKTLFIIEMAKQGVLIAGSHNVCYAHNEADVARALSAYGVVLQKVAEELATGALEKRLPCAPLRPAFTVR